MKRSKRLLALAILLILVSAATFLVSNYEKKQEEIKTSEDIILEIPSDSVTGISWKSKETTLSFLKEEETWNYEEDASFPVSEEKIMDLLSHFEAFGVSFIIEHVEDYSQYALQEPECTIYLTTQEEESYEIKLGAFSKMDEKRYIDIGDGNVYLVNEDPLSYLPTELSDLILDDTIPTFEKVSEISLTGEEKCLVRYMEDSSYSYSAEDLYFTEKNGTFLPLDTEKITQYLAALQGLSLSEYVTYHAAEEELTAYGFDAPVLTGTIHYTYTEGEEELPDSFTFSISQNPAEAATAEDARAQEEEEIPEVTKYIRIGDSPILYTLDESTYDILAAASYNDLRHDSIFWGDFSQITQLDITLEGNTHTLTTEKTEEETLWYYNEKELDIYDLRLAIKALSAEEFTEEPAKEKEEIHLTLYLDSENFPQIDIGLYRYDGQSCLAVIDGKSTAFLERSQVMELVEAVQSIVLQ